MRLTHPIHLVCVCAFFVFCAGCASTKPEPRSSGLPPVPVEEILVPAMPSVAEPVTGLQSPAQTYVVRKGDSLSAIAARFGIATREIAALNGISNPNRICVGQELALPADARERHVSLRSEQLQATATDGSYVIQSGDTLSKIAARFGTTVAALKQANGLQSDMIRAGKRLVIPGNATTPQPSEPTTAGAEPVSTPDVRPVDDTADVQ